MRRRLSITFVLAAVASLAFAAAAHAANLPGVTMLQHTDILGSLGDLSLLGGLGGAAIGSLANVDLAEKTKFFRIALEGATTDGRVIERVWLEQMAKNYNPKTYGARVNLEHYKGIDPAGLFKAYGDVIALETREEEGGKLGLYAQIAPTPELVAMTKAKQKIYTSCEIHPSFADTKEAYLVGLAVTDSPASLGTEVLSFAAKNPDASPFKHKKQHADNLFTATGDEVVIEFEQVTPSVFSKVKELLGKVSKKGAADDVKFADLTQAVETLATHGKEQAESLTNANNVIEQLTKKVGDQAALIEKQTKDFADLQAKLSKTPASTPNRPTATGATGNVATDC